MGWLACGVGYSIGYLAVGWLLRGNAAVLTWFRIAALLVPPLAGVIVIARRRGIWSGCQWLFWATIALGLVMSAVGLVGWTVNDLLLGREASWLGWYSVFALFGGVAPLLALLAQPHRGPREGLTATIAVDIAGIAVMTGFLYSHFVVSPDLMPVTAQHPSWALLVLCEFQQLVVTTGMLTAAFVARRQPWGATYRRIGAGLLVNFVVLSLSNAGIWQGLYRPGFVYDVIWILPFAFFPWAAATTPPSVAETSAADDDLEASRPWIVFGALALIPVLDFALRAALPLGPLDGFRDLFMAITIFSVLPLLMARLAVERDDARHANRRRRLLAAATEQADDLISIARPDGRIEHANSAFCRAVGCQLAEAIRAPAAEFVADGSRGDLAALPDVVRRDGVWRGTLGRRRKDGSTFLSSATVVALSDDRGETTHLVAVERDVTQETQLREQLIHSERLAAVGQLVSGVAHELNNPLQAVVGFVELLLEAERRDKTRRDLSQIRSEAIRAAKIVRNLLSFVRRSGAERVVTDLREVVHQTVALRSYELALASIQVLEEQAPDLPPVCVNREEIQQIVLNLILNAEQAIRTAAGSGHLTLRTAASTDTVSVEVEDDGPGIPGALAGRIFEPFFSTKPVGEGTGLGLSIAFGIAEAHGGSLTLQPTTRGACFRLTLPATAAAAPAGTGAPAAAAADPPRVGRRALVADDEPKLRELLERLLARRGFAVDVAEDGRAAAALLDRNGYDVVLCDVSMPNLGGLGLYQRLRATHPSQARAFVLITGDVLNSQLAALVDRDAIPVLSKPFSAEKVDAAVDQVLAAGESPSLSAGGALPSARR